MKKLQPVIIRNLQPTNAIAVLASALLVLVITHRLLALLLLPVGTGMLVWDGHKYSLNDTQIARPRK